VRRRRLYRRPTAVARETQQGDRAGARVAWERTIVSGHPDRAPKAALNLGLLLEQQGDPTNARMRLQQAIDSDHPDHAPKAMINLGIMLSRAGFRGDRVCWFRDLQEEEIKRSTVLLGLRVSNWAGGRSPRDSCDRELQMAAGAPDAVGDQLGLEGVDEALGHRVVVGVADATDRREHVVIVEASWRAARRCPAPS
jgi:tetratricopeptide (TPR) repeat protein